MAVSSRALVEFVLLGPTNDRRQLQDSPILGDVWIAYATSPSTPMDLLISPYQSRSAGPVAHFIAERLQRDGVPRTKDEDAAHVAYLQGIVAARLYFKELLQLIVPITSWWTERNVRAVLEKEYPQAKLNALIGAILRWAHAGTTDAQTKHAEQFATFTALDRYTALAGLILWAATTRSRGATGKSVGDLIESLKDPKPVATALQDLFSSILEGPAVEMPFVWQVSLNRRAMPALEKSVPAVKGDAARTLFKIKCDEIAWAVIDSGIDGTHEALRDVDGKSRVVKSFDFSNIRKIVSLDNLNTKAKGFDQRVDMLIEGRAITRTAAIRMLKALAEDAQNDRTINWGVVEKFVDIDPSTPPFSGHGTHVAGIIGASGDSQNRRFADGMCPDIKLYDFRVLAKTLADTEFAIIAALQYIRYLNERHTFMSIHGANLSLSIPHDVRNFACGRTPVCNECERVIDSGVVVVAAAGNLGYQSFETKDGAYEGYTAFSITDPGNADGVITVGATHRSWPHTYGVSFFSSRGPTGDGRMKPDLVAPGERIHSSLPDQGWRELDGTSMAAPHVSGAAAMLMARYAELVGQPRRIKSILCEGATDLGRERSFQGHGMLDVLRAFQRL
jgi:serine protease AprX